jgi:hypothetical protein
MKIGTGTVSGSNFIKAVGFSGVADDTATLRIQFDDATIDFNKVPFAIFKLGSQQGPRAFLSTKYLRRSPEFNAFFLRRRFIQLSWTLPSSIDWLSNCESTKRRRVVVPSIESLMK